MTDYLNEIEILILTDNVIVTFLTEW